MSRPQPRLVYDADVTDPVHVDFHGSDYECQRCAPAPVARPLPLTVLTFAGIAAGNAFAFLYDPHAALQALAATIGVQL